MVEKKAGESDLFKLSMQAREDSKRWFGDSMAHDDLGHMVLALCGEAGELANLVKKLQRGSLDLRDASTRHKVMMETTDIFVYLLNVAGILGLDLERSNEYVRGLNEKRFMEERAQREAKRNDRPV
jgi:NTP pyrophosphatase (non-canonical NTP hydrolase)